MRAFLHLFSGSYVERQQADRARVDTAVSDQVTGPLGEHSGLARTGRRDDPGSSAAVGDGGELVGCELGGGGLITQRCERASPEVGDRDDGGAVVVDHGPVERAGVAPARPRIGHDIAFAVARAGAGGHRHVDRVDGGLRWVAGIDGMTEYEVA